jgi:hypothetical protein
LLRHADESQHPFSATLVLLAFLAGWKGASFGFGQFGCATDGILPVNRRLR